MKKFFPLLALTVMLLLSCHGNRNSKIHNAAVEPAATLEDSLYRQAIALHDEVMPKMGKLIGYKNTVQGKIDSLDKAMPGKKNKMTSGLKNEFQLLLSQLTAAEKGMNDWMEGFNPDPQLPSKEDLIKYFENQKARATKMRNDVLAALKNADSKLVKN